MVAKALAVLYTPVGFCIMMFFMTWMLLMDLMDEVQRRLDYQIGS